MYRLVVVVCRFGWIQLTSPWGDCTAVQDVAGRRLLLKWCTRRVALGRYWGCSWWWWWWSSCVPFCMTNIRLLTNVDCIASSECGWRHVGTGIGRLGRFLPLNSRHSRTVRGLGGCRIECVTIMLFVNITSRYVVCLACGWRSTWTISQLGLR